MNADFFWFWRIFRVSVRRDRGPDDGDANSNTPFDLSVSFPQKDDTLGVFHPGTRERNGLRCHSSCDSPCDHGHRRGCGHCRHDGVLPVVRCPAAGLLRSLQMAQPGLL